MTRSQERSDLPQLSETLAVGLGRIARGMFLRVPYGYIQPGANVTISGKTVERLEGLGLVRPHPEYGRRPDHGTDGAGPARTCSPRKVHMAHESPSGRHRATVFRTCRRGGALWRAICQLPLAWCTPRNTGRDDLLAASAMSGHLDEIGVHPCRPAAVAAPVAPVAFGVAVRQRCRRDADPADRRPSIAQITVEDVMMRQRRINAAAPVPLPAFRRFREGGRRHGPQRGTFLCGTGLCGMLPAPALLCCVGLVITLLAGAKPERIIVDMAGFWMAGDRLALFISPDSNVEPQPGHGLPGAGLCALVFDAFSGKAECEP